MKHGSIVMTLKLSSHHHNVSPLPCYEQESILCAKRNQSNDDYFVQLWGCQCSM